MSISNIKTLQEFLDTTSLKDPRNAVYSFLKSIESKNITIEEWNTVVLQISDLINKNKETFIGFEKTLEAILQYALTFQIGTVTTTAPGSQAVVENVGTQYAPVLNFKIPRGEPGTPGAPGKDGDDGNDGATPEFSIGDVLTLPVESSAEVTLSGDLLNPVLNFKLPRGLTGPQGPKGDSLEVYKVYSSVDDMNADAANIEEGTFVAVSVASDSGNNVTIYVKESAGTFGFVTDLTNIQPLQGPGATVEIGAVETVDEDEPLEIYNTGTETNAVLNFKIPRGETGFLGSILTVDGQELYFFIGTEAEYEALDEDVKLGNLFAVITDDGSEARILAIESAVTDLVNSLRSTDSAVLTLQNTVSALSNKVLSLDVSLNNYGKRVETVEETLEALGDLGNLEDLEALTADVETLKTSVEANTKAIREAKYLDNRQNNRLDVNEENISKLGIDIGNLLSGAQSAALAIHAQSLRSDWRSVGEGVMSNGTFSIGLPEALSTDIVYLFKVDCLQNDLTYSYLFIMSLPPIGHSGYPIYTSEIRKYAKSTGVISVSSPECWITISSGMLTDVLTFTVTDTSVSDNIAISYVPLLMSTSAAPDYGEVVSFEIITDTITITDRVTNGTTWATWVLGDSSPSDNLRYIGDSLPAIGFDVDGNVIVFYSDIEGSDDWEYLVLSGSTTPVYKGDAIIANADYMSYRDFVAGTFTFVIDSTTYTADTGMRWYEWVSSNYAPDTYLSTSASTDVRPTYDTCIVDGNGNRILGGQLIISGEEYFIMEVY